ncbi:MAG: hypothetical protein WC821_04545 [archaeon]|jgi:uncharacterized membrane protein
MVQINKLIGVLLALVLVLSAVSAVSASGAYYTSISQCDTIKLKYSVCADISGIYSVSSTGIGSNWVTIAPASQQINAGTCADFYLFVTPSCYATAGTYKPQLIVNGPEDTNTSMELIVQQGHLFDFTITPKEKSSNPCVENVYDIYAKNTSKFRDEFVLVISGLPNGWSNYSSEKLILNPYEELRTQLKVKSTCNASAGDYNFNVLMSNTMTNISKSVSLVQKINKFSPFSLSGLFAETNYYKANTCEEFDKNLVFTATNRTTQNDELTLELLDANLNPLSKQVAYFDKDRFALDVNKPVYVSMIINKTPSGTIPIVLRATSKNYNTSYTSTIDIVSQNCYDLNVESDLILINADSNNNSTQSSCIGKAVFSFDLTNTGKENLDLNVSLKEEGDVLSIQAKSISINSNDSETVSFEVTPTSAGNKDYVISITSAFLNKDLDFNYLFENCYDASMQADNILVCKEGTVNQKFSVTNNGTKEQTFKIEIDSNWLSFVQNEVSVKGNETASIILAGVVPTQYANTQTITAISSTGKLSKTVSIVTLPNEECNDITFLVQKVVDANCCEGKIVPLIITNSGYFEQYITISPNTPPWVTMSDNNISLIPKAEKTVYVYLSPPAGTNGDYNASLIVSNDSNVSKEVNFTISVLGSNCGPALEADLNVDNSISNTTEFTRSEAVVDFVVTNDSNVGFNVLDISIADSNATVDFNRSTFLNKGESLVAKIKVNFAEGTSPVDKEVLVLIKTSVGDFNKTQTLKFSSSETQGTAITGWFTAVSMPLIGLLLIVLLALVVIVLFSSKKKKPKFRK